MKNGTVYQLFSDQIDPLRRLFPTKSNRSKIKLALRNPDFNKSMTTSSRSKYLTPYKSRSKLTLHTKLDQRSQSVTRLTHNSEAYSQSKYTSPRKTEINCIIGDCNEFNLKYNEISNKLKNNMIRLQDICKQPQNCEDTLKYHLVSQTEQKKIGKLSKYQQLDRLSLLKEEFVKSNGLQNIITENYKNNALKLTPEYQRFMKKNSLKYHKRIHIDRLQTNHKLTKVMDKLLRSQRISFGSNDSDKNCTLR